MILCSVSLFSQTKNINFDKNYILELSSSKKDKTYYTVKIINKTNVNYNKKTNLKYISSPDGRVFKCDKCKYEFKYYTIKKNNNKIIKKITSIEDLFNNNYKPIDVVYGESGFFIEKDYYQIMQQLWKRYYQ